MASLKFFLEDKQMSENRKVHFIPPMPVKRQNRVGIYCRVSSNSMEQLNSLTNQISALTRLTATLQIGCLLIHI